MTSITTPYGMVEGEERKGREGKGREGKGKEKGGEELQEALEGGIGS